MLDYKISPFPVSKAIFSSILRTQWYMWKKQKDERAILKATLIAMSATKPEPFMYIRDTSHKWHFKGHSIKPYFTDRVTEGCGDGSASEKLILELSVVNTEQDQFKCYGKYFNCHITVCSNNSKYKFCDFLNLQSDSVISIQVIPHAPLQCSLDISVGACIQPAPSIPEFPWAILIRLQYSLVLIKIATHSSLDEPGSKTMNLLGCSLFALIPLPNHKIATSLWKMKIKRISKGKINTVSC